MKNKIGAVIVTFNRIEKLKKALFSYESQTVVPDILIVVDNHSNDGTHEFLNSWEQTNTPMAKKVVFLAQNMGGAGGFGTGMKVALDYGVDWVWVADDDAYPANDAFEKLHAYLDSGKFSNYSVVCGAVYNTDNLIDCGHRSIECGRLIKKKVNISYSDYLQDSFLVDYVSYVGAAFNAQALIKCGITNKKLFIYYDDTEHSYRCKKYGGIVCFPQIKITHDDGKISSVKNGNTKDISWRDYYAIRNSIYFYTRNHFFTGVYMSVIIVLSAIKKYLTGSYKLKQIELVVKAIYSGYFAKLGLDSKYRPGSNI
jgi:GT2 family glycosyltransferase